MKVAARTSMRGLGVVTIGSGGSAADFTFDPTTGLSNDPRLAFDLQDLTPAQLQTALTNPTGITGDLINLLNQSATGTGAGWLPCGSNGVACDANLPAAPTFAGIPLWLWVTIGAGAFLLLKK